MKTTQIQDLKISNTFTKELPGDEVLVNTPRQVKNAFYSFVNPAKPSAPQLICTSDEVLDLLGIENADSTEFLQIVSGNKSIPNSKPYAMCYGGHQFGQWAGQLGDGRAINIGEVKSDKFHLALQLKGAGPTPYSRNGDGFAVLRSSIREFLISEAMHHLGIPTTRALSLALTGDMVMRDVLYNGNPALEKGAIVCRVAPTFIRFGNFEIFAARQDTENLKKLLDYTLLHFYPSLGNPSIETYLQLFKMLCDKTKDLIIHWQRVGFVHGVMNTDNMSIIGETIDYGPYGWLENFDPNWTPNTTDAAHKRYKFGNQAQIALWNLTQLANALYPLIPMKEELSDILNGYKTKYALSYLEMMRAKLGLQTAKNDDNQLFETLEKLLEKSEIDMTRFFRNLSTFDINSPLSHSTTIKNDSYLEETNWTKHQPKWNKWLQQYTERLQLENLSFAERVKKMNAVNPKYVLRNYMAQLAIEDADKGDYGLIKTFHQLLKNPFAEQPSMQKWFAKRPNWAIYKVGCSMLSCSS